jgi:hypothetical protein
MTELPGWSAPRGRRDGLIRAEPTFGQIAAHSPAMTFWICRYPLTQRLPVLRDREDHQAKADCLREGTERVAEGRPRAHT